MAESAFRGLSCIALLLLLASPTPSSGQDDSGSLMLEMLGEIESGKPGAADAEDHVADARKATFVVHVLGPGHVPIPMGVGFLVSQDGAAIVPSSAAPAGVAATATIGPDGVPLPLHVVRRNHALDLALAQVERPAVVKEFRHLAISDAAPAPGDTLRAVRSGSDETVDEGELLAVGDASLLPRAAADAAGYTRGRWLRVRSAKAHDTAGAPVLGEDGRVAGLVAPLAQPQAEEWFALDAEHAVELMHAHGPAEPPPLPEHGFASAPPQLDVRPPGEADDLPSVDVPWRAEPAALRKQAAKVRCYVVDAAAPLDLAEAYRLCDRMLLDLAAADPLAADYEGAIAVVRDTVAALAGSSHLDPAALELMTAERLPAASLGAGMIVFGEVAAARGTTTIVRVGDATYAVADPRLGQRLPSKSRVFVGGLLAGNATLPTGDAIVLRHGFIQPVNR